MWTFLGKQDATEKNKVWSNFLSYFSIFWIPYPTPCQYVSFGNLVRKYNSPITIVMSHVVEKTQNLTMRPYPEGMGFSVCFKLLKKILSVLNINGILLRKLFWPTVRNFFANSRPSASNFKSFSQSLEHFFSL